jgi:hypothetical protein
VPVFAIEASLDWPLSRFQTKTFENAVVPEDVPPEIRLVAVVSKATKSPSLLIEGFEQSAFTVPPPGTVVTRVVVEPWRSLSQMFIRPDVTVPEVVPDVVDPMKLPAPDWNATKRPSPEMLGCVLSELAGLPLAVELTSWT